MMTYDYAMAREFLEERIELLDNNEWRNFFDCMWGTSAQIAKEIIKIFIAAEVTWDETARQDELIEGVNAVLNTRFDNEEIYIYDLYQTTGPGGYIGSWLGYTSEEFYDIITSNADRLKGPKVEGSIIKVGTI